MKVLWHSAAPWSPSGYGQQTALFAPRIRELGHDVALSATWGLNGGQIEWAGMRLYPSANDWGNGVLPMYAADHSGTNTLADVQVITLMDVWTLKPQRMAELRMACWCPVDHEPLPLHVKHFFDVSGARPIAMSRFGERMLAGAGFDPLYVPHGIDTSIFRPQPEVREALRRHLQIPDGGFVVGMVAANIGCQPPRKAFPQVFEAFAELRRRHDDAFLYLHTDVMGVEQGVNLMSLAGVFGIPEESIRCSSQLKVQLGITQDELAGVYQAFDVLANPSYGEGFGIPIVEAQACGVPVIVTDHSAMPELCGAGWLVDGLPWYDTGQGAFFKAPLVPEIVDALELAYEARADDLLRARARAFAVDYDAALVVERDWRPALDALAGHREVGPLMPGGNRQQRRAAARGKARA